MQFRGCRTVRWWWWGPCGQWLRNEESDGHPAATGSPTVCPLLLGGFSPALPLSALEKLVPVFKLCSESHCKTLSSPNRESITTTCNHWCLQSCHAAQQHTPRRGSRSHIFVLGHVWNKSSLTSASRYLYHKTSVQPKLEFKLCKSLPRHLKPQQINSATYCIYDIPNKLCERCF